MYKQFANLTLLNRIKIFCHQALLYSHPSISFKNNIMRKKNGLLTFDLYIWDKIKKYGT